jgi:hypothetical protein
MHLAALSQCSSWIGTKSIVLRRFLGVTGAAFATEHKRGTHCLDKILVMIPLCLRDQVFLVIPFRRGECVANGGQHAVMVFLDKFMVWMPEEQFHIQFPCEVIPCNCVR